MYCTINKAEGPRLTLDLIDPGELFTVDGVNELQNCVCAISAPAHFIRGKFEHSTAMNAARSWFGECATDRRIAVTVVGCTTRETAPHYVPTGYEVELLRETHVTLLRQLEPLVLRVAAPQPTRTVAASQPTPPPGDTPARGLQSAFAQVFGVDPSRVVVVDAAARPSAPQPRL